MVFVHEGLIDRVEHQHGTLLGRIVQVLGELGRRGLLGNGPGLHFPEIEVVLVAKAALEWRIRVEERPAVMEEVA